MVASAVDHGYRVRPKGLYPFIDGILHPELLPPQAAHELTVADRNYQTPYVGVTTDGDPRPGLYSLMDTGISGQAAARAAAEYLNTLRPHYRAAAVLPVDSPIWRRPARMPTAPPMRQSTTASTRNCRRILAAFAPTAIPSSANLPVQWSAYK